MGPPPDVLLVELVLDPVDEPVGAGEGLSPLVDPPEIALPHEPEEHDPFTVQLPAPLLHESSILLPVAVPEQLRFEPSLAVPLKERLDPLMLPESFVPFVHEMSRVQDDDWTTVQLLSWHEPLIDHLPLKSLEQLPAPPLLVPPDVPLHAMTRHPTTTTPPTMLRFIRRPPHG